MNEDKIKSALESYNADAKDAKAQETLRRQLGGYAVIARGPDGKVDVAETMENLGFAVLTGETAIAGCLTVEQLLAKPLPKVEADPVDGRPLRRGRTVTDPIVDWSAIPQERRRLVGFARATGQLPHSSAVCRSESVAADMTVPPSAWPAPWPRLSVKWAETQKAAQDGDKAARALVEAVDESLWFSPQKRVETPALAKPAESRPDAVEKLSLPSSSGGLDIFFVAHGNDHRFLEELTTQCFFIKSKQNTSQCPAGTPHDAWLSGRIAAARVVVVVLSANLLCDERLMRHVEDAATMGKRVVPIVARACAWQTGCLTGKNPLPSDPFEASQGLKRILAST